MYYIGVDPGVEGGIAVLSSNDVTLLEKMPEHSDELLAIIPEDIACESKALLERITPRPMQSLQSIVTSCVRYGHIEMWLQAKHISHETISAYAWQKGLGVLYKPKFKTNVKDEKQREKLRAKAYRERKKFLREKAAKMFPSVKVTNATSDALLIAEFCRRRYEQ